MKNVLLFTLILLSFSLTGQSYFVNPVQGWSLKKVSVINLKNGEKIEGNIKNMKVKKGLVKEVVIKVGDEKRNILAGEIANMYVAQNSIAKLGSAIESANDLGNFLDDDRFRGKENEMLKDGYTYYESHLTEYRKGKELDVLLIVVNPFFADKITVFHDPFASETVSTGVAGMKIGGHAKSYFIKKGDGKVYRLKKKDFKDSIEELFDGCDAASGEGNFSWLKVDKHIFNYTTKCE